jgi:hypothetical protein
LAQQGEQQGVPLAWLASLHDLLKVGIPFMPPAATDIVDG